MLRRGHEGMQLDLGRGVPVRHYWLPLLAVLMVTPATQHVPLGGWWAYVDVDAPTLGEGIVSYVVIEPNGSTQAHFHHRRRLSGFGHRTLPINVRTPGTYQVFVTVEGGTQAYGAPATIQVGE